jgi:hypothetical protein
MDQPLRDVFLRLIPALPTPQPWQLVYQRMVPIANQPDANPVYAVDYDPTFEWFQMIITVVDPATIPATPWSNPIFTTFQMSQGWSAAVTSLAFSPDGGVTLYQSTDSPSFTQVKGAYILAQPLIQVGLGAPGAGSINRPRLPTADNNAFIFLKFETVLPAVFQTQVVANVHNLNIAFAILKRLP